MTIEFEAFPKLARLNGPIIVTEKIDGTNACIIIENDVIAAQSRTKIITPEKDNFGFARWVHTNKDALISLLGEGRHYGEWWGNGIQRGYGLKNKAFSLFNVSRWADVTFDNDFRALHINVVPVLLNNATLPVALNALDDIMANLKGFGSVAAPGYMNPEGVVIYDTRSGTGFKKTYDYDDTGKGGQKDEHGNSV